MPLKINGATNGSVTLAAPATGTDTTLVLPGGNANVITSTSASFANPIEIVAGSASAPSIYSVGDINTGVFFPSADTIAFAEGGTEAMRIDNAGRITKPNQPYSRLKFAGTASNTIIPNGGVVVFNTADVNIGSCYNTANGRFTAPVSGKYFISVSLQLSLPTANNTYIVNVAIYVNGSIRLGTYTSNYAAVYFPGTVNGIVDCNANDYIDIRFIVNTAVHPSGISMETPVSDPRNFATFMLIG